MQFKKNKKIKELTAAQEAEIRQGPQFIPLADFVGNTILCHGLHETYEKAEDGTVKQVAWVKMYDENQILCYTVPPKIISES